MKLYNIYYKGKLVKEDLRRKEVTDYFGYAVDVLTYIRENKTFRNDYTFEISENSKKAREVVNIQLADPIWNEWDKTRLKLNPNAMRC